MRAVLTQLLLNLFQVRKVARSLRREGIKLMIAFVGSREGEEEQDRALFETMVESKRDLFMIRYTLGLKQVAKKMVQDLCPVPSKCHNRMKV